MARVAQPTRSAPVAALYVRVSSARQEEEGTSLETQEAALRTYAVQHGYAVDEQYVYREVYSGVELWERPRLTALREAVRRRDVDVVLAYAIDRLSRDPVHLGVLLTEADHAGVRVEFVTEPLDDSPEGQLIRFVRGYAAKVEHEKIKERAIRGRRARAQAGKLIPSGRPRYGFAWKDDTRSAYVENPQTAPVVRRILHTLADGGTLRGLAARLTAEGIPTPTGKVHWGFATIHNIAKDPIYTGEAEAWRYVCIRHKGSGKRVPVLRDAAERLMLPPGTVPQLVTPEVFAAVQERLRVNRERAARNNHHPEVALLRGGLVRCGYCGSTMRLKSRGKGRQPDRYGCMRRGHGDGYAPCRAPSITIAALDGAVWTRAASIFLRPELIAAELEKLRAADPTEADLAGVDRRRADLDRKIGNLAVQLEDIDDRDAAAAVRVRLQALTEQRRQLDAERDAILARRKGWHDAASDLAALRDWCATVARNLDILTYAERRMAVEALGIQVRVWREDAPTRYEIEANLPTGDALPQPGDGANPRIVSTAAR